MYNPMKDYRPYAIGANLKEKMNDGIDGEYVDMVVYENIKNGKERLYNGTSTEYTESKIWEDTLNWKFKEMRQTVIVEGKNASIMDFRPTINLDELSSAEKELSMIQKFMDTTSVKVIKFKDLYDGQDWEEPIENYDLEQYPTEGYTILDTLTSFPEDITDVDVRDAIINEERIVMVVSKNLEEGSWSNIKKIKALYAECKKKNIPFILICNATREDINKFRKKNNFNVPTFSMDEIELKIISRSNPSIVVLENGVVKGKYPYRSTPSVDSFRENHLK
jgi:hypothetical protein